MYDIYCCILQRNVDKSDKYVNVMKLKTTQLNIYCTSLASRNIETQARSDSIVTTQWYLWSGPSYDQAQLLQLWVRILSVVLSVLQDLGLVRGPAPPALHLALLLLQVIIPYPVMIILYPPYTSPNSRWDIPLVHKHLKYSDQDEDKHGK